ncbi:MAG: hypothetical protein Q8M16_04655 [Pirellulaceae bacterium]|nr:hypothetical protein [Pirellulaceae bacterium]
MLCRIIAVCIVSMLSNSLVADEPSWNAVSAGVFESLNLVDIKCEFKYQRGIALNAPDAEKGAFTKLTGEPSKGDTATGILVKYGDFSRFHQSYEMPTDFRVRNRTGFSTASLDVSGGKSVLAAYYPKQLNKEQRVVGGNGSLIPDDRVREWYDIGQFCSDSRFSTLFALVKLPGLVTTDAQSLGNVPASVVLSTKEEIVFELKPSHGEIVKIWVDISSHFPLVTRTETEWQTTIFSDYVELSPGFRFARKVVTVNGPFRPDSPTPFWIGHIWQATSVTSNATESDLDVVFEADPEQNVLERVINVCRRDQTPISFPSGNTMHSEGSVELEPIQSDGGSNDYLFTYMMVIGLLLLGFVALRRLVRVFRKTNAATVIVLFVVFLSNQVGCDKSQTTDLSGANGATDVNSSPVHDLGIVLTSNSDQNLKRVTFSFTNKTYERALVNVAGSSCSCASVTVNGEQSTLLDVGQNCDVEMMVELPRLLDVSFFQTTKINMTCLESQEQREFQYSVSAVVYPKLQCTNRPSGVSGSAFTLESSGTTSLRLHAFAVDRNTGPIHVEYNRDKLIVDLVVVKEGVDDGVHFQIVDAHVKLRDDVRSSFQESLVFVGNNERCSVDVQNNVRSFMPDRRAVFFRANGAVQATMKLQLVDGRAPSRIEFDNTLIDVKTDQIDTESIRLVIDRRVDSSFQTKILVWSTENTSDDPDLVIPSYCL